jgi:hypothetical protein
MRTRFQLLLGTGTPVARHFSTTMLCRSLTVQSLPFAVHVGRMSSVSNRMANSFSISKHNSRASRPTVFTLNLCSVESLSDSRREIGRNEGSGGCEHPPYGIFGAGSGDPRTTRSPSVDPITVQSERSFANGFATRFVFTVMLN